MDGFVSCFLFKVPNTPLAKKTEIFLDQKKRFLKQLLLIAYISVIEYRNFTMFAQ
jgi:hypothetical protein